MRRIWVVFAAILFALPLVSFGQWIFDVTRPGAPLPYQFGTDSLATDGFDTTTIVIGSDTVSLDGAAPPPPMSGISAYFPIDDPGFPLITALLRDMRGIADTVQWGFYVSWIGSGSEPETLMWNTSSLPSSYGVIYMDTLADMSTAFDMSTRSNFVIEHYPLTIYWQFIAGAETTDTEPPYATNWYPTCGDDDVPVDIDSISVDILDAMSGVDESSISISVMGFDVTMLATITEITGGYHIAYHPTDDLPYDLDIPISISADDSAGNHMSENCTFHTETSGATGHKLSGFVYDTTTGAPLDGAAIMDITLTYGTTSDDTGYYEITNIPDGEYVFTCARTGYGSVTDTITISGADEVHNFYLRSSDTLVDISGTVEDESGDPINEAIITATWGTGSATDTSASDGTYLLSDVLGGTPVLLVASHEGYISDTVGPIMFTEDSTINFVLVSTSPETYTVSGTITLEDASVHSGTQVILSGGTIDDTTTTAVTGAYSFSDIPPGTYTLSASHDGYVSVDTTVVVTDADVTVSFELEEEPAILMPPRNASATTDFAWYILISWDAPMEPGEIEMHHYTGDAASYFFVMHSADIGLGVKFVSPGSEYVVSRVRVATYNQMNGEPIATAKVIVGDKDFTEIDDGTTSTYAETWWMEVPFSSLTVPDTFTVSVFNDETSVYDTLDVLATNTTGSGDGAYSWYHDATGWSLLGDFAGYEDYGFMIEVYMTNVFTGRTIALDPITVYRPVYGAYPVGKRSDDPLGLTRKIRIAPPDINAEPAGYPMYRTFSPMDVTGYRVYRSTDPFTSTTDPGVEMIYETTADTLYYFDTEVEPEDTVYYGITALYPEGESPLSEVVPGYALEIRPSTQILIFDYDGGDTLAENGTMDEAEWLYEYLQYIGVPAESIYLSEQDEFIQHFFPYTDYISYFDDIRYSTIFWVTGAYPNSFFMYSGGGDSLIWIEYMNYGGNLYIEGVDFAWYMIDQGSCPTLGWLMGADFYHDGHPINPSASGVTDTTGNVDELTVIAPSFFGDAEEFTFDYNTNTLADLFVDVLEPITGAQALMRSQTDVPDSVGDGVRMVYFDAGVYKSVLSSIYLGAMVDGLEYPELRTHILGGILDAFGIDNSYVNEKPSSKPEVAILLGNTPNPFNASTEIFFKLPENDDITLEVLDVNGRVVRNLVSGDMSGGVHSIIWDGRDDSGTNMPSGIYTYRLTTSTGTLSGRMALVK